MAGVGGADTKIVKVSIFMILNKGMSREGEVYTIKFPGEDTDEVLLTAFSILIILAESLLSWKLLLEKLLNSVFSYLELVPHLKYALAFT